MRSEEHTSELQSLLRIPYAVFCLNETPTTEIYTDLHTLSLPVARPIYLRDRLETASMAKSGGPEAFNSSSNCSVRATSGARPADHVAMTVSVPRPPLASLPLPLPFKTRVVRSLWWP